MIRDEEIIRDKLNFYKERDIPVHLPLYPSQKDEKSPFRRGKIKEIKDSSVIIEEEKLGEILILLKEIIDVDKRQYKKEVSNNGN